jgi:septal ring factor EnvC (AmiA/AmiB activator)
MRINELSLQMDVLLTEIKAITKEILFLSAQPEKDQELLELEKKLTEKENVLAQVKTELVEEAELLKLALDALIKSQNGTSLDSPTHSSDSLDRINNQYKELLDKEEKQIAVLSPIVTRLSIFSSRASIGIELPNPTPPEAKL